MASPAPSLDDIVTRRQVFVERLKAGEVGKFGPFLAEMDAIIREALSRDDLTGYARTRLNNLLSEVDSKLADVYARYGDKLTGDLFAYAHAETEFTVSMLANVTLGQFVPNVPAVETIRAAVLSQPLGVRGADGGKLLDTFIKDWTVTERQAVVGAIRRGAFEGQTNQQVIRAIRGTRALKYKDGLLNTTTRHAAAVVQTAVQHVASVARGETYAANDDVVQGYVWISTLDSHTSAVCRSLSLRVFKLGKGPMPPAHINCRSTTRPLLAPKYEKLMAGSTMPAVVNGKVQHVDATTTYYAWLKTQPLSFIEQAIGESRAKLLLNGGLSAERFAALNLSRNFSPLTLAQMRALDPVAFARAGL